MNGEEKFYEYFGEWTRLYKTGSIRQVTMNKYIIAQKWIEKLAPDLKVSELNRQTYQQLINDYAAYHEKQTVTDFHHIIKASVLDAVDDGFIERDPTRKVVIKGRIERKKKQKYLNQSELKKLLDMLELGEKVSLDCGLYC